MRAVERVIHGYNIANLRVIKTPQKRKLSISDIFMLIIIGFMVYVPMVAVLEVFK